MKMVLRGCLFAAGVLIFAGSANAQSCAADLDGNGVADQADVELFQDALGTGEGDEHYNAAADLNFDGVVNMVDFGIFLNCN